MINEQNQNFNFPLYSSKCELPDGSIFISGGDYEGANLNTCYIFSQQNGLIQKRQMNIARKLHSSIFISGFVYIFGGFNGDDIFNSVERYDIYNDSWNIIGNMNVNRAYTSLLRYGNDYIFIIGGAQGLSDNVNIFLLLFYFCRDFMKLILLKDMTLKVIDLMYFNIPYLKLIME